MLSTCSFLRGTCTCTALAEQLLSAQRDATTVLRHFVVLRIGDSRAVELRHHLVNLLRAADERAEGKFVIRAGLLDLLDVIRVGSNG